MKAISIRQPWAALIVAGIKDIENRSWPTQFRGRLLIHAAQKIDKAGIEMMKKMGLQQPYIDSLLQYTGGIIGEVEVVDCVKKSDSGWFEGPYGFVLKNAKVLKFKPMKGMLGIFNVEQ